MDTKKKRNKKKKGNQGKNTGDVKSSAGEDALQHHNHESAPTDLHNGEDADDAMSCVGDGVPRQQSHELTPMVDGDGTNADTMSSFGEMVVCYQNNEPTLTQENHKVNSAVPADQRSIGMSESSMEFDIHKLNDAKLVDKLYETIKHLEDEKSLWLQKVSILESELEKLHDKVSCNSQNEILLEEKLNNLQNGYDLLVKKEEALDNKVRCMEDINDTLTHQEASFKERLNGLQETNQALQSQVKVLEETSNNIAEENQRLVKGLNELDSRVQELEAKATLGEVSMSEMVPQFKVTDQTDLAGPPLHQQTGGFNEVYKIIADPGLESSVTIGSDNNYSQINSSPSNAYTGNRLEETSLQHTQKASTNNAESLIDLTEHQFDKSRTSEEIVPVLLDDIQIHEDDAQQSGADDETAEVPFSDAPIIGAPFRLISFVARYVSGADLVSEK